MILINSANLEKLDYRFLKSITDHLLFQIEWINSEQILKFFEYYLPVF